MKKLILSLAIVAMAFTSSAQFVQGPATGPALLISGAYRVNGSLTSNAPPATVFNIPIGRNGVGIFIHAGGTNAATVTNATIRFQASVNGTDWTTSNAVAVVSFPQTGTTPFFYYTNMVGNHVNWGNARFLRVNSIQNTNLASLFITNILWSIKE